MSFIAAAVIGGVGTIAGGLLGASASSSAADAQANAANAATQAQLQMFNTTQNDYKGQIALGGQASTLLSRLFGEGKPNYSEFDTSPGYQYALQQGQAAINKSAASSGNLYSTSTLAALDQFNQGQASTQYNSYVNQLMTAAGLGNAAASGVGSAATATGGEIGNNMNLAGSAAAAGTLGGANAFSSMLGSGNSGLTGILGNYYQGQQAWQNQSDSIAATGDYMQGALTAPGGALYMP